MDALIAPKLNLAFPQTVSIKNSKNYRRSNPNMQQISSKNGKYLFYLS